METIEKTARWTWKRGEFQGLSEEAEELAKVERTRWVERLTEELAKVRERRVIRELAGDGANEIENAIDGNISEALIALGDECGVVLLR